MIVCITEKPSVARDIAKLLGATRQRKGFLEGDKYCVTWTFGHLCCLKEPGDYTPMWQRWALSMLPMIPPKFGIKLIDQKSIEEQFDTIKRLVANAEEVINCGDPGQEGELIQRWVMQLAGVKCPVKRLWTLSLTDDALRKGFQTLKPESDYTNLYYAGLSRAIGDWVLGINATRLYTIKYKPAGTSGVLSVGRVQTPTLALIVERQRQIENFKPEDYWELKTVYRDTTFNATTGKFKSEEAGKELIAQIADKPLTITDVVQKQGKESPRRLFDLTSLQVECNKLWGWSAEETLRNIQALYEKKVTTYPRVDTTFLPDDIYPEIPKIMGRMTPYANLTAPILAAKIPKSKKVFDNAKVTDHHAIIPTGESPSVLVDSNERKLYHLIAMRFIMAFYPDCVFMQTTVTAQVDKYTFRATGKVIKDPGWRALEGNQQQSDDDGKDDDNRVLPAFEKGESGPHKPALQKKTTQPPKLYTEGTLLRAMETAGKTVDDDDLRDALKENGIGRPSTRAAIIEILFKRHYITRVRKSIQATQAGCDLIDTIRQELLKSAKLTGIWENKLRRIERGDYQAADFINEIKQLISDITIEVISDTSARKIIVDAPPEKPKRATKKQ